MKHFSSLTFLTPLLSLLFPLSLHAQTPDPAPAPQITSVQLNQPFASKDLGSLTLPFMWNISEESNRVIAVENSDIDPAVITVDSVKFPNDLKAEAVATNTLKSLAQALNTSLPQDAVKPETLCPENPGAKKCKNPLLHYAVSMQGSENNIPRACAFDLYISQAASTLIALSFCAPADKAYDPDPAAILKEIFSLIE